ncbi:MAG: TIGR02444 family protein [Gammaproteobacteria bacterium]|nr:MAG: TIGR02444 family protein [Gammaproteobacteria bacterium]
MIFPESKLWDYSTQIYQLADVESSCLLLQNRFDADVNILLYCCWLGEQGIELNASDIDKLVSSTQPWQHSMIKPLREARRMMKQHIIALPGDQLEQTLANITEMEINAEHMAQLSLEKAINLDAMPRDSQRSATEIAAHNLLLYSQQFHVDDGDILQPLGSLLDAVFQDAEATQSALMLMAATS